MRHIVKYAVAVAAVSFTATSAAMAQFTPLPISLGDPTNSETLFSHGLLFAVIAAGIVGGIWLVRRKQ